MATAEAGVCNRALLRIGQSQLINNLQENSAPARACAALYAHSRDATLEARAWPFARRRATLTALTDGERGGWDFAYTVPADFIAARFIDDGSGDEAVPVPFEVEDDEQQGRIILTDQTDAELVYTARITAVARFTPTFLDCLAYLLASDLAFGVAKKPAVGEAMLRAYEHALARAAGASAKQRKPRRRPLSLFERNR